MQNSDPIMADVKLHGLWGSPFTQRVVWALKLKGVSYEYVPEELDNKSNLLLQYNPVYKKVPVLVHGGKPIAESLLIIEYIDETWPENPLLPKDPYERATVRFWAKFIDDEARPMYNFFKVVGEEQENEMKHTLEVMKIIEEHGLCDKKKFFGGDQIGLADIALGWITSTLEMMEEILGVKFVQADAFPRLHAWVENFKDIPAIKDNVPEHDKLLRYFQEKRDFHTKLAHVHH